MVALSPFTGAVCQRLVRIAQLGLMLVLEVASAGLVDVEVCLEVRAGGVHEVCVAVDALDASTEVVAGAVLHGCAGHDNHVVAEGRGESIAKVV